MSSLSKISAMIFDHFVSPQELGVLRWHRQTKKQTDGHGESMTDSGQRANSVKTTTASKATLQLKLKLPQHTVPSLLATKSLHAWDQTFLALFNFIISYELSSCGP